MKVVQIQTYTLFKTLLWSRIILMRLRLWLLGSSDRFLMAIRLEKEIGDVWSVL
jgi:hypothetical protein